MNGFQSFGVGNAPGSSSALSPMSSRRNLAAAVLEAGASADGGRSPLATSQLFAAAAASNASAEADPTLDDPAFAASSGRAEPG